MIKKLFFTIRRNKVLFVILFIAALLRFIGTYPGYNQFHADEGITYSAATSMIKNKNLDPLRYDYPALVPTINYIFFKTFFIPTGWGVYYARNIDQVMDGLIHIPPSALEADRILRIEILGERERNALFWGRIVTALFSLGNVLLVYILARRLFNKQVALIASFLLTFNFKHVINSHIGLPDIYNAFFVLLVLIACMRILKNPSRRNYLLGGIAVGLSLAIKYQFFAVFPFAVTHLLVSIDGKWINFRKLFSPVVFASALSAILVFIVINPYHILNLENTLDIVHGVSQKYGMGVKKLNLYPFWYFNNIDYGFAESILIIIGTIIAIRKYFLKSLLLLSHAVPFMFMMVYYSGGGFYIRNFITVTPIFLIFAGIALFHLYLLFRKKLSTKVAVLLLIGVLLVTVYVPGRNAVINSYFYTKPWGYDIMRPWVKDNIPPEAIVATHPFDAVNLGLKNKKTEFEVSGAFSLNEHKENKASYLLLDLNWVGNPFYFWMSYGLDELDIFGEKPLNIMRNTYHGVAAEEFFRYQVHAVTKPWQAPDTHLLAIKFLDFTEPKYKIIKNFDFEDSLTMWKIYGKDKNGSTNFSFDKDFGRTSEGSLVFLPGGARYPTVRATSELIEVKEGHLYKVNGFLKTEQNLTSREREGFLRLDFYENEGNLDMVGENASVSSRVYGSTDWTEKNVIEIAPPGAKYMTVSFQTYITTRTKIWLDDITISESETKYTDPRDSAPYIKNEIDLNYVYPNSHGNL